jgi:hypothetical protein
MTNNDISRIEPMESFRDRSALTTSIVKYGGCFRFGVPDGNAMYFRNVI